MDTDEEFVAATTASEAKKIAEQTHAMMPTMCLPAILSVVVIAPPSAWGFVILRRD